MILPTDFRGLTRLFKKHNVKLVRGGLTHSFPNCCVLSALGVINGTTYSGLSGLGFSLEDNIRLKLDSIEIGFEGWGLDGYNSDDYILKYVEIGRKLYKWSLAKP